MRKDFTGSFYFKETTTGNLLGEFINNDSPDIHVESAKLTTLQKRFEGTYDSIWNDGTLHQAELTIKKGITKFKVEWIDKASGGINYEGEGIIVGDILAGYYKVKP